MNILMIIIILSNLIISGYNIFKLLKALQLLIRMKTIVKNTIYNYRIAKNNIRLKKLIKGVN